MKNKLLLLILLSTFAFSVSGQNWTEKQKLQSLDQQTDDNLGIAVAISGDYVISGAWHHDLDGAGGNQMSNAGAAYIYHYDTSSDTWTEEAKLLAADREAGDWFGVSVDISGTYAVIGAVEENAARGAAYVFEKNGSGVWVQVAKLEATVRQSSDRFGNSVSISGNTIIVGAFHEDEDENELSTMQNAGSAYVYTRTAGTWGFSQKIVASDRDSNDYFGYSVAVWEDKIIVGAYHRDIPTLAEYGGAYAFAYNGVEWEQTRIMEGIEPYYGDRFGWSVDVYENYYIVGAPYHDYDDTGGDAKNNAGAAYIFDENDSWAQVKVVGGDRTAQDNVGEDVAIHGTRAVVGAPLQDYSTNGDPPYWGSGGAAFVYEEDGGGLWNQTQKLLTNDRFTSDKFGHSIDLDSETIIGGAPEDNSGSSPSTGALYVFKDSSLNLGDINSERDITLYPNPTNGKFQLSLEQTDPKVGVEIFNTLGQRIFSRSYSETNMIIIDINNETGLYFVQVSTSEGTTVSFKVIKI